ncbi:unnamed protein product [Owenia fusiformis]|uniref:Uncharacterized protein n=1 Tax=Owenia fusiformis TaxID=6347 RepID=A0A8S4NQL0_OWEFU|nr:unnamed protein product [Owenia fusiformis]
MLSVIGTAEIESENVTGAERNTATKPVMYNSEEHSCNNSRTNYVIYLDDNNNSDKESRSTLVETKPRFKSAVEFEPCFKFTSKTNEVQYFRNSKMKTEFSDYYSWNKSSVNIKFSITPKTYSTTLTVFPKPDNKAHKTEVTHNFDNRGRWSVNNACASAETEQNKASSDLLRKLETMLDKHSSSEQDDTDSCDSEDIEVDEILRGAADDLYQTCDVIMEEEENDEMDITSIDQTYHQTTNIVLDDQQILILAKIPMQIVPM